MYISLHIHVLTHVNVPISVSHVTIQNKYCFDVLAILLTTYDQCLCIPV